MLHCSRVYISSHFRDKGPQAYWGHNFDLSKSRDVSGHVTNRFAIRHSVLTTFGNKALYLTVFEMFASKYIWVTTLTFQGRVSSPVTWPFYIPGAISYRWYIVTNSVCISSHFCDNRPQRYWVHDRDLSRSRHRCCLLYTSPSPRDS